MNPQQNALVVMICGRLDALTGPDHEKKLKQVVENGAHRLVLDMTTLDYISSAGLRVLLTVLKAIQENRGQLVLAGVGPNVASVLTMSGLDSILQRTATVAEALASIGQNGDSISAAETSR